MAATLSNIFFNISRNFVSINVKTVANWFMQDALWFVNLLVLLHDKIFLCDLTSDVYTLKPVTRVCEDVLILF